MHASGSVAASEVLHLFLRHEVEIARDSVLEGRCCHSKLQCLTLIVGISKQAVDKTTRERVAATHAVDDGIDIVAFALVELLTIVDKGFPTVVRG